MSKRRADGDVKKSKKTGGRGSKAKRTGYDTVARTRGVYAAGEMKYFDTICNAQAVAASADWTGTENDPTTFLTLCVPQVGAAINQRIGKAVNIHKIKIHGEVRLSVQAGQMTTDAGWTIRLALVQDLQSNGAQAQGEQVFTGAASTVLAVNTFQNIDNFGRFRVLKDKFIKLEDPNIVSDSATNASWSQNGKVVPFKWTVIFKKPVVMRFNATNGGTIADIVDNSFHVMANTTVAGVTISYCSRVCYKE